MSEDLHNQPMNAPVIHERLRREREHEDLRRELAEAQARIQRLELEAAEDAEADGEIQEIPGRYVEDSETAEARIAVLEMALQKIAFHLPVFIDWKKRTGDMEQVFTLKRMAADALSPAPADPVGDVLRSLPVIGTLESVGGPGSGRFKATGALATPSTALAEPDKRREAMIRIAAAAYRVFHACGSAHPTTSCPRCGELSDALAVLDKEEPHAG